MEEVFDSAFQNIDHQLSVVTSDERSQQAEESNLKKPVIFHPPPQKLKKAHIPKLKTHQENENVTESQNVSVANIDDIILQSQDQSIDEELSQIVRTNFRDLKAL